jgi:hypothetical protein
VEKIVENKNCKKCNSSFEITEMDLEFYEKISPVFSFPVNENEMNITNIQESNICSFE